MAKVSIKGFSTRLIALRKNVAAGGQNNSNKRF